MSKRSVDAGRDLIDPGPLDPGPQGAELAYVCRAWMIKRQDGISLGFTDHDEALSFDATHFSPITGMRARSIAQSTGLSVDNAEALGVLSSEAINEADIAAGLYDGAEVFAWRVPWQNPQARELLFRGKIGEIERAEGAFRAELRGLTDVLNQPAGRIFQRACTASLGDHLCRVDLRDPAYRSERICIWEDESRRFRMAWSDAYPLGWFVQGRFDVLSGPAKGLWGRIKADRLVEGAYEVELWEPIAHALGEGAFIRLSAGCDKRFETCRGKFDNVLNFMGFPDIPEDDWILSLPQSQAQKAGGSRR